MLPPLFSGQFDALTLYQMATLCRLHYKDDPGSNYVALLRGLSRRFLRTDYMTAGGSPAPRTVKIEFADYSIFIVRGSVTAGDWYTNLVSVVQGTTGQAGEGAGAGWYAAAGSLYTALFPTAGSKEKPVIFVGHSAGGAIALCLAHRRKLDNEGGSFCVVNFGSPLTLNAAAWARLADRHVIRVVRERDYVEDLPPNGAIFGFVGHPINAVVNRFVHGGTLVAVDFNDGRLHVREGETRPLRRLAMAAYSANEPISFITPDKSRFMLSGDFASVASIADQHQMWRYARSLRQRVRDGERAPLGAFDSINASLNIADSVWDTYGDDFKAGYAADPTILPDDLPFPIIVTEPLTLPEELPEPSPLIALPSAPVQATERARRLRRNI